MLRLGLVASLLVTMGTAAQAQTAACPESKTTVEMTNCLSREVGRADDDLAALTVRVKALMARDPKLAAALARSEKTWLAYRTETCDDLMSPFWAGGTIQAPATLDCRLRLTRSHIADLDHLFNAPLHH